jgi:hypothetical protein
MNESETYSVSERLQLKCRQQFGEDLGLSECYELLKLIIGLESRGATNCYPDLTGPLIEHNSDYYTFCSSFDHLIAKFLLPILQLFCLFGNGFNLLIYRLPYFDGSSSVNFLRAKAIANFIFVQSRVFEVFHAWSYEANEPFETWYWSTKPFIITVANISGTISTWLTLFITVETALCVTLPFSFRQLCTRRTTFIVLISSIGLSIFMHMSFFFIHSVRPIISIRWTNEFRDSSYFTPHWTSNQNFSTMHGIQPCWYIVKVCCEQSFYSLSCNPFS